MSSRENGVTLQTYSRESVTCLALQMISDGREDYIPPLSFVTQCFEPLGKNARVLEVGSGDGYLAEKLVGLNIVASEAVEPLLCYVKELMPEAIRFNIIDDKFPSVVDGILAWRVFIHFSPKDLATSLEKSYRALNPGGRLVFNVYNVEAHPEYDGGAHDNSSLPTWAYGQRFYFSYGEEFIRKLAEKASFDIVNFHKEGNNDEWLVFVLEKPQ